MPSTARSQPFSLTQGGPFHRLMVRLRIERPDSRMRFWWLAFGVWLPLVIGEGVRLLRGSTPDPTLGDISTHARLLFSLPMILFAERLFDEASRSGINSMYHGRFCDRATLDRLTAGAERLRDSWMVEAALLVIALAGGQLVMWGGVGSTGVFHGGAEVEAWTFPRLWYAIVAFPLVQFVTLRWLWRWAIWSYLLVRISRQPLAALATHADLAAGLAPLGRPVTSFSGFVLAESAILAGAWGTQVLEGHVAVQELLPELVTFLLISLLLAVAPLLAFSREIFRARRRGLALYGDFVRDYILRFHAKWIEARVAHEDPLGSPDIQSLNDLGQAYQVVSQTRVFVFGPRMVFTVWAAGILPMIPLFAGSVGVEQVLKRIVGTVLGGFPF